MSSNGMINLGADRLIKSRKVWSEPDSNRVAEAMLQLWIEHPDWSIQRLIDEAQKQILPPDLHRPVHNTAGFDKVVNRFRQLRKEFLAKAKPAIEMIENDGLNLKDVKPVEIIEVFNDEPQKTPQEILAAATLGQLIDAGLNRFFELKAQHSSNTGLETLATLLSRFPTQASPVQPPVTPIAKVTTMSKARRMKIAVFGPMADQVHEITHFAEEHDVEVVCLPNNTSKVRIPTSAKFCIVFAKFTTHSTRDKLKAKFGDHFVEFHGGVSEFKKLFMDLHSNHWAPKSKPSYSPRHEKA